MSFNPRKSALTILNRLETTEKTLDALLDDFHDTRTTSPKRDRALMHALIYGVLRQRRHLDAIISHFSKTGLRKIKPDVLNILRMGVYQIVYMDRIPVSAAVNTSVEMAKSVSAQWTVRFVNAILRRVSSSPLPEMSGPAEEHSIPDWLFSRWEGRFGDEAACALASAVNDVPPITARTNTLLTTRPELMDLLSRHVSGIASTAFSPEGVSFHSPKSSIPELPGFEGGLFQIQDEAAQLTGHLLSPLPGERVLDACAGLGGKTGHLGQLMKNQGKLFAVDREKRKLDSLEKEMSRLGITIVIPRHLDLSLQPDGDLPLFDRILLDAPCSGLGVIRRNPDTKWRASESEFSRLHKAQSGLLSQVSSLTAPGGTLLYVVCSTEPEENESVIRSFLKFHPEFAIDPIPPSEVIPEGCITGEGVFKSYPNAPYMDGFFAARLMKIA